MLLAILGRGIQKLPSGQWVLTEDLEVCSPTGAHLIERLPIDDRNPHCLVSGSELNLLAGVEIHRTHPVQIVVCAYAARAPYLVDADAPSESEIMSNQLKLLIAQNNLAIPEIVVWPRDKVVSGISNTQRELRNIFELAVTKDIKKVVVVTVTVHLPRTISFAKDHLIKEKNFRDLRVNFLASEQVLVEASPRLYTCRVLTLYSSQAFIRSAFYEHRGIMAFLNGTY